MNLNKSLAAFNEAKRFMPGGGRFKSGGTAVALQLVNDSNVIAALKL